MDDDCRFVIPEDCREFDETSFDERRRVAKDLVKRLTEHVAPPREVEEKNAPWTTSVRGRFIDICPLDCTPWPKDRDTSKGEFLVDYSWEEKEKGKRLLLAAESEWGIDQFGRIHWYLVEDDFEKLLSIKAIFKVLIFSSVLKLPESQGTVDGAFSPGFAKERLRASLRNYGHHLPGEVYIFIDLPQTGIPGGNMIYQSFLWLAKRYGKPDVEFEDSGKGTLTRVLSS